MTNARTEALNLPRAKEEPLLDELAPYYDLEFNMVHHPLVVAELSNTARAGHINKTYRDKKAGIEEALAHDDWHTYLVLHERPYRVMALEDCEKLGLKGDEYWSMVGWVWIDSENVHQWSSAWRRVWSKNFPGRHITMNEQERAWLAGMPEKILVWRGTNHRRSIKGLSWTTDIKQAEWFARRFQNSKKKPLVASAVVLKADVYAAFLGRDESEIVSARVELVEVRELS